MNTGRLTHRTLTAPSDPTNEMALMSGLSQMKFTAISRKITQINGN